MIYVLTSGMPDFDCVATDSVLPESKLAVETSTLGMLCVVETSTLGMLRCMCGADTLGVLRCMCDAVETSTLLGVLYGGVDHVGCQCLKM